VYACGGDGSGCAWGFYPLVANFVCGSKHLENQPAVQVRIKLIVLPAGQLAAYLPRNWPYFVNDGRFHCKKPFSRRICFCSSSERRGLFIAWTRGSASISCQWSHHPGFSAFAGSSR